MLSSHTCRLTMNQCSLPSIQSRRQDAIHTHGSRINWRSCLINITINYLAFLSPSMVLPLSLLDGTRQFHWQRLSATILLRYGLGVDNAATRIENAVLETLNEGLRTGDIFSAGKILLGWKVMAEEVLKSVDSQASAPASC